MKKLECAGSMKDMLHNSCPMIFFNIKTHTVVVQAIHSWKRMARVTYNKGQEFGEPDVLHTRVTGGNSCERLEQILWMASRIQNEQEQRQNLRVIGLVALL